MDHTVHAVLGSKHGRYCAPGTKSKECSTQDRTGMRAWLNASAHICHSGWQNSPKLRAQLKGKEMAATQPKNLYFFSGQDRSNSVQYEDL